MSDTEFYLMQLKPLLDGKITALVRTGVNDFGEEFFGMRIQCKDGKTRTLFFLADDEGNGPGSFELTEETV